MLQSERQFPQRGIKRAEWRHPLARVVHQPAISNLHKIARATKREGFLFGPRAEASRDVATGTDIYLIPLALRATTRKEGGFS
jgi:hypothetical protein